MEQRHYNLLFFIFFLPALLPVLLLDGCASVETGRNITPDKLEVTNTLLVPFTPQKCQFDQNTGTLFLMEANRPYIYFFRNGKQVYLVGGYGTDKTNFQKLSDIALDPDGNLLALDEFALVIRKFSYDSKWIADISINSFSQPSRFCATPEGNLIIYDSARKELQKVSGFDGKVIFSFGRFQVESVSSLSCSRDYIAVVDHDRNKTVLFSSLGMFQKELPEQVVLDEFQNQYAYQEGAVWQLNGDVFLPFGWTNAEVKLNSAPQQILLLKDKSVLTISPGYQRR